MKILISKYIAKHELKPLEKYIKIDDVKKGAQKIIKGLGKSISMHSDSPYRFYKVRIGTTTKGRMIVFLITKTQKIIPLLIRLKKDKKMGENISAKNPLTKEAVSKNLSRVLEDVENKQYQIWSL
jgi:hypothetical protein